MSATPDSSLDLAFDPTLIPQSLQATAPTGLHLRPLASSDYARGHLELLATLTEVPDIGQEAWKTRFDEMVALKGSYYPVVYVESQTNRLVASGTLLLERKFIRGAGLVGHIEDIAVAASAQGKGLGKKLIEVLTALSETVGAYKTILDCNPKNEAFYVKCGYENKGVEMARYVVKS